MTGTTEVALIVVGIGAVATAIGAPLANARLQRRNARRAAHEPAVAAARLIERELDAIRNMAEWALEHGEEVELPTAAWNEHKVAVAGRLAREEVMVLERYYAIVAHGPSAGVMALHSLASDAIRWLAIGERHQVKPRKIERSLAPQNMDLPCECGHIFGHHGWRAVRRRIRIRHFGAKYIDRSFECKRCDCTKFRGMGKLRYG